MKEMEPWNMEETVNDGGRVDLQDFDKAMNSLFENDFIQRCSNDNNSVELA